MITVLVKVGGETQKANYIHTYMRAQPLQGGQMSHLRCTSAGIFIPRATSLPQPLQQGHIPCSGGCSAHYIHTYVYFIHNHRQARKRMTIYLLPGIVDKDIVLLVLTVPYSFHGQPCARNHRITSRRPPLAAFKTNWTCFLHP